MQRLTFFFGIILALAVYTTASVVVLTPDNFDTLVDGSRPAFIEFYAPWCGHCKKLAPEYDLVGAAYKNKAGVLVAQVDCDEHRDLCSRFDVSGYPTLKWFQTKDDIEPYNSGRTAEDIIRFINAKTGLKARVPGAAPSQVVTLTPSNFEKVILDKSKDVFVKFYAPWCGHCKKLEPTYEDFARVFGNEESVVVARVDCDAHRELCSRYDVSGYPTLKFFPKGAKSDPIPYNGDRDIEGLVNFINEKSGTKRLTSGSLDETSGILDQFSDLIETFRNAADKSSIVAEAEKLASSIGSKMAKVYQRAFQQIAKDAEYVKNEISRLERMIESGSLSSQKIDEFTQRANILRQFQ